MKTKILKSFFFLLLFLHGFFSYSQEVGDPLNQDAFDKNIMQDINFMVLGNNNLKQGVSYEYDEKRTELSLTGALANRKSYILTIDGAFSVDDGVFVFDNKDGSTKGTAGLNLFIPAWFGNGKFYPATSGDINSGKVNRARHLNRLIEIELPEKVLDTFMTLDAIMGNFKFPQSEITQEDGGLFGGKLDRQNNLKMVNSLHSKKTLPSKDRLLKALLKYYNNPDPEIKYTDYDTLLKALNKADQTTVTIQGRDGSITYNVPEGLDIEALFNDYDKIVERAKNIDEEISDKQIKKFKGIWTFEYNTYFGISPYYERESLTTYDSNSTATELADRFTDKRGDLYGLSLTANNVWRSKKGAFAMIRGLVTFGRDSNFKDFEKKDYIYNSLPEPIGTGTIIEEQKKTGYYTAHNTTYGYGLLQKYSAEIYLSSKVVGLYGKFGYSKNEARYKKEVLPLETGLMINLQSEKKNVVSILLFVAREDLNVHPDKDTNFGFKIGLPINIKKRDKEEQEEKKAS